MEAFKPQNIKHGKGTYPPYLIFFIFFSNMGNLGFLSNKILRKYYSPKKLIVKSHVTGHTKIYGII